MTYSDALKWTRLIVAIALIIVLILSFAYQRISVDDLLRAVVAILAMNNVVGSYTVHKLNGSGRGE